MRPCVPVGTSPDATGGMGWEVSLTGRVPNRLPDGRGWGRWNDGRVRREEFAKKFGIPVEESFFRGVGGLRDIAGTGD